MRYRILIAGATLALCNAFGFVADARAQQFFGGATAFDPEIDVVESGAVLDAQAIVSADRKYVTMTVRPQVSTLIALRDFTFQAPAGGFVGSGSPPGGGQGASQQSQPRQPNGGRGDGRGPLLPAMAREAPPTPILHREGMMRLDDRANAMPAPQPTTRPVAKP